MAALLTTAPPSKEDVGLARVSEMTRKRNPGGSAHSALLHAGGARSRRSRARPICCAARRGGSGSTASRRSTGCATR